MVELHVVDDGRNQVVGEVAGLEFLDFGQKQVLGLFEGLVRTR